MELDEEGNVISHEEYYPYGSTSYQALRSQTPKRYRYTEKERDEETGLDYYGARYYAHFLARWCSADPTGISAGINVYEFVDGNPVRNLDPDGNGSVEVEAAATAAVGTVSSQAAWALDKVTHPVDSAKALMSMHPIAVGMTAANQQSSITSSVTAFAGATTGYSFRVMGGVLLGMGQSVVAIGSIPRNELELLWHMTTGSPAPTRTGRAALLNRPWLRSITGGDVDTTIEGTATETVMGIEAALGALIVGGIASRTGLFVSTGRPMSPVADPAGIGRQLNAASGSRVIYVAPSSGGTPPDAVIVRTSGSGVSFDTPTDARFVRLALERVAAESPGPGTQTYIGSGTHGTSSGSWAAHDPGLAEYQFVLEDMATTSPGKLPGLGPRHVFDVATGEGATTFQWAENTASSLPPGSITTMKAWCFSTLSEPLSSVPVPSPVILPFPVPDVQ